MSYAHGDGRGGFVDRWQLVGAPDAAQLGQARPVVAHAMHVVSQVGRRFVGEDAAELEWLSEQRALASELVDAERPFRAGLRLSELTLLLLDADGATVKTLPLDGASLGDAFAWVRAEAIARGLDADGLDGPPESWPALPDTLGGRLAITHRPTWMELERWYGNADRLLRHVARTSLDSSPVRCDVDTQAIRTCLGLSVREGEQARSVVVGMEPAVGEGGCLRFFVRPEPPPPADVAVPELPHPGSWERDPSTAAVIRAEELALVRDADAQAATVRAFFEAAIPAAHGLVRREWRRR